MKDHARMILQLRQVGISAADIVRWGKKRGRNFSVNSITTIARRCNIPRQDIGDSIQELFERLCND